MMLLYDHPLSPYAQKCRIALREKGIAFEARLPEDFGSGRRDTLVTSIASSSSRLSRLR